MRRCRPIMLVCWKWFSCVWQRTAYPKNKTMKIEMADGKQTFLWKWNKTERDSLENPVSSCIEIVKNSTKRPFKYSDRLTDGAGKSITHLYPDDLLTVQHSLRIWFMAHAEATGIETPITSPSTIPVYSTFISQSFTGRFLRDMHACQDDQSKLKTYAASWKIASALSASPPDCRMAWRSILCRNNNRSGIIRLCWNRCEQMLCHVACFAQSFLRLKHKPHFLNMNRNTSKCFHAQHLKPDSWSISQG